MCCHIDHPGTPLLIKACIIIVQFCAILKPLLEACFDRMSPNVAEWACKIATGVTGQYWFNPNGTQLVFRFTWDMNGGKVVLE